MSLTKGMNNRKAINTKLRLRPQLPNTSVFRFIVYEVATLHGEPCRTVFDIAEFSGIMRNRKALKWLRQLDDRGCYPHEVFVEY